MDFDHRDPLLKTLDVSDMIKRMFAWETVLAEVAKCDLVCTNCHRLRTYHGNNSYKTRRFMHHSAILSELKSTTPCLDCGGFFKPCQMDFDHTGDKVDNIARLVGGSTEALLSEVAKCHLVCANCHRERGHTGVRPEAPSHGETLVQKFREIETRTALPSDQRVVDPAWKHLLGTMTDTALAKQVGLSNEMVGWFRRREGIAAFRPRQYKERVAHPPKPKSWHVLAGTLKDAEVARLAGITSVSVCLYRKKMGIPSFTSQAAA
jgi:hypothetical protein